MQEKLQKYANLLREWNEKINLVAPSTINDIETRHFADSAQLADYLPKNATVIDMGSGAGFPAVVLAIIGYKVIAIESTEKKANFLRLLKQELNLSDLTIYSIRLEDFIKNHKSEIINNESNVIFTARAFASLAKILDYLKSIRKSRLLLLKGRTISEEIAQAKIGHRFDYKSHPSKTGDGFIVEILTD